MRERRDFVNVVVNDLVRTSKAVQEYNGAQTRCIRCGDVAECSKRVERNGTVTFIPTCRKHKE